MFNGDGTNRLRTIPIFLACTIQAGGPWYLPGLLFVGG